MQRARALLEGHAPRRCRSRPGALRHRCQRPARIPAPRTRSSVTARSDGCRRRRGSSRISPESNAGTHVTVRRPAAPALSAGRCGAAPRFSGRLDLGAALQQRHHQRGRRSDRRARGVDRHRRVKERGTVCSNACRRWRSSFVRARPTRSFIHSPRLAFRSAAVAGPNWALLPSAAGMIDPLLSSGFPLTLLGVQRLACVELRPVGRRRLRRRPLRLRRANGRELDATEQLVAALYASMSDFEQFKRLTLLYFAAASFSETARRWECRRGRKGFSCLMTRSSARKCARARRSHLGAARERSAGAVRSDRPRHCAVRCRRAHRQNARGILVSGVGCGSHRRCVEARCNSSTNRGPS